jgi:sulfide:quinone oxidoreductase
MTLTDTTRRKIVIIGDQMAGLRVMGHIFRVLRHPNVTIIAPSEHHDYKPLWPLVATGMARPDEARRPFADFLPDGAEWIKDEVKKIDHADHIVQTEDGTKVSFEYLVICSPMERDYGKIKGIDDAKEAGWLCSTASHEDAVATQAAIHAIEKGTIVFAQPQGAQEDGSSLQFAFLVDDILRQLGKRQHCKLVYVTASSTLFPEESYAAALETIATQRGIEIKPSFSLTKLHAESNEAEFGQVNEKGKVTKDTETIACDLIHVAPLVSPPTGVAKNRKIAAARGDDKGKLKVDLETLQQPDYPIIFGVGESLALPIPSSDEALRRQAEVAGYNVVAALQGKGPGTFKRYDGTTSLYMTTAQGRGVTLTMRYPTDTPTPLPTPSENAVMWWKARHILPRLYWRNLARGRA